MTRTVAIDFDRLGTTITNAASTDDLIVWDKLKKRLAEAPPPLSDAEFAELIVKAANDKKLTGRERNQLVGIQIVLGADARAIALRPETQALLVQALATIVDGKPEERKALEQSAADVASERVLLVPSWSSQGRRDRLIATSISGAIAYGIMLLSNRRGPFASILCRCNYKACEKFFFKRFTKGGGPGAPARKYCSTAHRTLADRAAAKERMRQIRKRPRR